MPRAAGKWTPAEETDHVTKVYEILLAQLRGGPGMKLLGSPWRRIVWRIFGLTSILYLRRIPVAVRAPREVRPAAGEGEVLEPRDRDAAIGRLRAHAAQFGVEARRAWHENPRVVFVHAYFGRMNLWQALRMSAVHTRHHARFLAAIR